MILFLFAVVLVVLHNYLIFNLFSKILQCKSPCQFFYANLTYDFLERFFITAGFSYLKNHFETALLEYGLTGIIGGAGFRLSDNVTIKAQYTNLRNNISKDPMVKVHMSIVGAGVSVYF